MRVILPALLCFCAAGCDDHIFESHGADVPEGGYTSDWDGVNQFWGDSCTTGCHESLTPILPDDVEDDLANGTGVYVVAGDPESSLMWQVVAHTGGVPMPFGSPDPLPIDTIQHIYDWIEDGAVID